MTSEDLVNRRQVFHNALLQLVKDQHSTFLASLNPPITVPDNLLTAWHKWVSSLINIYSVLFNQLCRDFLLDQCNPIDEVPLPLPGLQDQALSIVKEGRESEEEGEKGEKENSPASSNTPSNLPSGLLEKVRAKEAAKAVREMTRTAEEKKRIERLRRMPDLARLVGHQKAV